MAWMGRSCHVMERLRALVLSLVLLLGTAHAAVTIPDMSDWDTAGSMDGILWQGDFQAVDVSKAVTLESNTASQIYALSMFYGNESTTLPLGNNSVFKMGFTGRLTLTDETTGESATWESNDPNAFSTQTVTQNRATVNAMTYLRLDRSLARTHKLRISGNIRPVLMCLSQPCATAGDSVNLSFALTNLKIVNLYNAEPISMYTVINKSTISIGTTCAIDLSPGNIQFGNNLKAKSKGSLLATASSTVKATCRSTFWSYWGGYVLKVWLVPEDSDQSDDTLALMSREGLGVRYTVNDTPATCSRSQAESYRVAKTVSNLTRPFLGERYTGSGTINWALCQTADHIESGNFSGRVSYTIWID